MMSIGLLCQHYDFDTPHAASAIAAVEADGRTSYFIHGGGALIHVYEMLRSLATAQLPHETTLYAYKGLGQIMVCKPALLMRSPFRPLLMRSRP